MNEQKKWYELPINERLKQVYKRFSIEEFWNWWSNAEDVYMELRINNKRMMFDYAKKYKVPVSKSGIFVNSAWKLRKAIEYFRNHDTIWYGVNPRRRIPDKYGRMRFQGLDVNVSEIRFLFIDIDRRTKNGAATNKDLMDADFVAEKVKDELDSVGFANNYIKICSGNGVQILFKLDVPIKIPGPKYDEQNGMYIEDTLFKKAKNTIRKGIGEILESYSKKLDVNINAEIDKTCFNLNRVGALPFTYNFKHGERIPRGIVELEQKGVNQGVSDYINKLHDMKDFKSQEKKSYTEKNFDTVSLEYLKIENKLHKNKVIDLMLNHRFPDGYINNTLWYSVKLLLQSNGVCNTDSEYITIHEKLKKLHDRGFSDNGLEPQFKNNYNGPFKEGDVKKVPFIVNKYLRTHKIERLSDGARIYHKPVFPVSPFGKTRERLTVSLEKGLKNAETEYGFELDDSFDDPLDDVKKLQQLFFRIRRGDYSSENNVVDDFKLTAIGEALALDLMKQYLIAFLRSFKQKWGDEIMNYMAAYYMDDYLNTKRW